MVKNKIVLAVLLVSLLCISTVQTAVYTTISTTPELNQSSVNLTALDDGNSDCSYNSTQEEALPWYAALTFSLLLYQ